VTHQSKAYLYGLMAVLCWSTVASAFKIALRSFNPVSLLVYASAAATVILFATVLLQRKWPLLLATKPRELVWSAGLGFLNPFLYYVMLFKAYQLLPGQEAQPLNYIWAIALVLLSIPLLKQKIRAISLIGIFVSFLGVFIISTRGHVFACRFTDPVGVSLAVGSSLVWAFFWIYNLKDSRDEVVKFTLSSLFGFLFSLIFAFVTGALQLPTKTGLLAAGYSGVFEMGLTFVIWLKALRYAKTTAQISNLIFLSPFISLVLLHLIVGEDIYLSSVTGLVFIVAGIFIQKKLS
jgi:drug/metabolite transporter (DMT)-like permease